MYTMLRQRISTLKAYGLYCICITLAVAFNKNYIKFLGKNFHRLHDNIHKNHKAFHPESSIIYGTIIIMFVYNE